MSYEHLTDSVSLQDDKNERYKRIIEALPAFFSPETSLVSSVNNVLALLHQSMDNLWSGFYFVDDFFKQEPTLFLGFFQGAPACDIINFGRGVCGTALKTKQAQIVRDVELFPGHIACSSASRSEIVVPLFDKEGRVFGVLDLDSAELGAYDEADQEGLEEIMRLLSPNLYKVYNAIK